MTGPARSIIPARALDDPRMTSPLIHLLTVYGAYADREGRCWPSRAAVAKRYGATPRNVRRATAKLVELGYLDRSIQTHGRVNDYRILYDDGGHPAPPFGDQTGGTQRPPSAPTGDIQRPPGGTPSAPRSGGTQRPPERTTLTESKNEDPAGRASARADRPNVPAEDPASPGSAPRVSAAPSGGRAGGAPPAQDLPDWDWVLDTAKRLWGQDEPFTGGEFHPTKEFPDLETVYQDHIRFMADNAPDDGIPAKLARKLVTAVGPEQAAAIMDRAVIEADDPRAYVVAAIKNGATSRPKRRPEPGARRKADPFLI